LFSALAFGEPLETKGSAANLVPPVTPLSRTTSRLEGSPPKRPPEAVFSREAPFSPCPATSPRPFIFCRPRKLVSATRSFAAIPVFDRPFPRAPRPRPGVFPSQLPCSSLPHFRDPCFEVKTTWLPNLVLPSPPASVPPPRTPNIHHGFPPCPINGPSPKLDAPRPQKSILAPAGPERPSKGPGLENANFVKLTPDAGFSLGFCRPNQSVWSRRSIHKQAFFPKQGFSLAFPFSWPAHKAVAPTFSTSRARFFFGGPGK